MFTYIILRNGQEYTVGEGGVTRIGLGGTIGEKWFYVAFDVGREIRIPADDVVAKEWVK